MGELLKVLISSTEKDLTSYRKAAVDEVLAAQWLPSAMEYFPADPRPVTQLCEAAVAQCGLVLLLVAFRRGWVPGEQQGGDGQTAITALEVATAERLGKPVLAFLADDGWPGRLWDRGGDLDAVERLRQGLNRNARFFRWEDDPALPEFRAKLRLELANHQRRLGAAPAAEAATASLCLRPATPPGPLPPEPYPLMQAYDDPRTFAGRDREVDRLEALVHMPQLLLCLHAPSGAGKSSLLLAGLAPRLRAAGVAVATERAPGDPGLAQRLLRDLLLPADALALDDDDPQLPRRFAQLVGEAQRLSGQAVVLVLDQIDDILRNAGKRDEMLARVGPLMAATAQRLPGGQGHACKWLLCYRHEFHGEVRAWLEDVLAPARRLHRPGLEGLPHDLSDSLKAHDWAVPVMGRPAPGMAADETSLPAFRAAIVQPLALQEDGRVRYPYRLPPEAADRIAGVFAQARLEQPTAPLVPELQVVLNHLLQRAGPPSKTSQGEAVVAVDVPEGDALRAEIGHALEQHLERALHSAFPDPGPAGRRSRALALLALGQLADAQGRRGEGLMQDELAPLFGAGGEAAITRLAAADTRILVASEGRWALSHDRLAEAVAELLGNEAARGRELLDPALIDLQRAVGQKVALFQFDARDRTALALTRRQRVLIAANAAAMLQDDARRAWWQACTREHVHQRIRAFGVTAAVLVGVLGVLMLGVSTVWKPEQVAHHWPAGESGHVRSTVLPGGSTLYAGMGMGSGFARQWDGRTARLLDTHEGNDLNVYRSKLLVRPKGVDPIYVVDIETRTRQVLPYRGGLQHFDVQLGARGEAVMRIDTNAGEAPRAISAEVDVWSLRDQRALGTIKDIPVGNVRIFYLDEGLGRLLTLAGDGKSARLSLWGVREGKLLRFLADDESSFVVDHKNGTVAVAEVGGPDKTLRSVALWNLQDGSELRRASPAPQAIAMRDDFLSRGEMQFNAEGSVLVIGGGWSEPKPIVVLDTRTLSSMKLPFLKSAPLQGRWLFHADEPDRFHRLLISGAGNDAHLWDLNAAEAALLRDFRPSTVGSVHLSRGQGTALVVRKDRSIERWDVRKGVRLASPEPGARAVEVDATAGDDGFAAALESGVTAVHLFAPADGQPGKLAELPTGQLGGDSFTLGIDAACSRINAWLKDGRVLRFTKQLQVFGIRLWTYGACPDPALAAPAPASAASR